MRLALACLALALGCNAPITTSHGVEFYTATPMDVAEVEAVEDAVIAAWSAVPGHRAEDVRECVRGLPVWVAPGRSRVLPKYRDLWISPEFSPCDYARALVGAVDRCYRHEDARSTVAGVTISVCF